MMFRRKKSAEDVSANLPDDDSETLELPVKPGARPAAAAAGPMRPPVMPPRQQPEGTRDGAPRKLEALTLPTAPPVPAPITVKREVDSRKLIVGREISLSGEITSCDRLVVEGSVEANLANCRDIEISESGVFKGSASIEDAEIRGRFEGVLHVRRRLLIRASGRVTGTVRYGQVEIECGGQISGDVQAQPTLNEPPAAAEARAAIDAPSESHLVE
ncbi:MAG TPA: polymer-forming cytoskeletal protein [Stellaceae bacterium]|nr:polymer-forming cytoskeletal protein [Stellaceae bacterium]